MKTRLKVLLCAAAFGASVAITAPASAAGIYLSFDAGNVAFAYQDGWWDRDHHWHAWRDRDEWRYYRRHYHGHYYAWNHDRDHDMGWRNPYWRNHHHRYDHDHGHHY